MNSISGRPGWVVAILALSSMLVAVHSVVAEDTPPKAGAPVRPDADASLRKRALELNNVTGSNPVKGEILTLIKDEAGSKRLLAVALQMTKEKEQPFNVNATYILAATAHLLRDIDTAQAFYRLNIREAVKMSSGSKINQGYGGLIELLLGAKKYADCEKVCSEFLELEGYDAVDDAKPTVLRRKIVAIARQDHYDKAYELVDKLIKSLPDNPYNVELKGEMLHEQGKDAEAAKLFENLIEKVRANKAFDKDAKEKYISIIQYRLSNIYIDLNEVDKAADHLKALLAKEPDNPTYNNDLGYIWADHDRNLAESEKLIRKAIDDDRKERHKENEDLKPEEDKDNAAFLDSLGWVLFKQKKFKEAKPPLLQAVQAEEGKHLEIYDHLGDVHMALGEKAEAIAAWKKGVEAAGKTQRELQRKALVEKKLKDNQ